MPLMINQCQILWYKKAQFLFYAWHTVSTGPNSVSYQGIKKIGEGYVKKKMIQWFLMHQFDLWIAKYTIHWPEKIERNKDWQLSSTYLKQYLPRKICLSFRHRPLSLSVCPSPSPAIPALLFVRALTNKYSLNALSSPPRRG